MTCEELRGCFELHALGVLGEPERSEAEEHLRRECPNCSREMSRAREINAMVFATVPDVVPPARLRKRIMASVGAERPRSWLSPWLTWTGWAASAAAVAAIVLLWGTLQTERQDQQRSIAIVKHMQGRMAQMESAVRMMTEPDTRQVTFGKGPQGRVLMNPKRGVLFLASNLPPAPEGRIYELWIIPKGGAPRPSGLFQSDAGGNAMHMVTGPIDIASTGAFAVSVEPEAGSPAPTTTPIIVAPVGD
jgi:anti-sigma-K factor RskA